MRRAVWCVRLAAALTLGWLLTEFMPGAWPLIAAILVGVCMTLTHYLIITSPKRGNDHVVRTQDLDDPQRDHVDP